MPRILVVEDDAHLRTVIRMVLEQASYEVSEAPDGVIALDQLADSRPDLVLVDLKLPRLSGLELIERMKADPSTRSLPVVLLTGNTNAADDLRRSLPVVLKPFEKASLLSTLKDALDRPAG